MCIRDRMDIYNRGGFHGGYYHTRNGREMISLSRPNHAGVEAVKVLKQQGKQVTAKALRPLEKGDVLEMPDKKETYTAVSYTHLDVYKRQKRHLKQAIGSMRKIALANKKK